MLSSHLYLGLPLGFVVKGFHLNIFLVALASGILCMWPNQLSLWDMFILYDVYLYSWTVLAYFVTLLQKTPP